MRDASGRARVDRMLSGATLAALAEVQPALLRAGNRIANTMRQLAPEDTGDLKNSIAVTPAGQSTPPYSQPGGESVVPANQVAITAGNTEVRYAHLAEFGTAKAPAQPFFWPGFRLERRRATNAIRRSIAKAVRTGATQGK